MINIEVYSTHAVIRAQQPLTVGLTGAKVHFTFDDLWKPLNKTAVFRCGETTVSLVIADGEQVQIPGEVLTQPGVPVRIGVYGTCDEGKLAIPTVWAETDAVQPGADPEDAASPADPTAPVWAQLQSQMGSLEHLQTDDKTSLVAAVNEANRSVVVVKVLGSAGSYSTEHTILDLIEAWNAGKSLVCYWEEQDCWLPISKAHPKETGPSTFCFSTTAFGKLYSVQIKGVASGGAVSVTVGQATVATAQSKLPNPEKLTFSGNTTAEYDGSAAVSVDIPTKMSQLTNDSNFLTKAVTSINGQTGDVMLPTTVQVELSTNEDGSLSSSITSANIAAAHGKGNTVYCKLDANHILPLFYVTPGKCIFGCVYDDQMHTVTVIGYSAEVASTPISSGGGSVNLTGYATEEYVNKAIEDIELTPGPAGPQGPQGEQGDDYQLTEADKKEIAAMAGPSEWQKIDVQLEENVKAIYISIPNAKEVYIFGEMYGNDAEGTLGDIGKAGGYDLFINGQRHYGGITGQVGVCFPIYEVWEISSVGTRLAISYGGATDGHMGPSKTSTDVLPYAFEPIHTLQLYSYSEYYFDKRSRIEVWYR